MLKVRVLRISQNMTLWDLSRVACISQGRLSMLERGLIDPTEEERERLSQILHAAAATLFRPACRVKHATAVQPCAE
jgi:transcriptional regulator with XRE-family HTH domain